MTETLPALERERIEQTVECMFSIRQKLNGVSSPPPMDYSQGEIVGMGQNYISLFLVELRQFEINAHAHLYHILPSLRKKHAPLFDDEAFRDGVKQCGMQWAYQEAVKQGLSGVKLDNFIANVDKLVSIVLMPVGQ